MARAVDLAETMNVSKPTVSVTLKNLASEGYIRVGDGHELLLTDKGRKIAEAIVDRHKIFFDILVSLGIDEITAEDDACHMEHAISPKSFEALKGYFIKAGNKE